MTESFDIPVDRFYDQEHHLWVLRSRESNVVKVGMDALGLASLGHLAYVKLEGAGKQVKRGDTIGTLEAEKMTSTLVAPVSGTLLEFNDEVLQDPLLVNRDPHGGGWLFTVETSRWEHDMAELITGDAVAPWVAAETQRYRSEGWIE